MDEARGFVRAGQIDAAVTRLETYLDQHPGTLLVVEEIATIASQSGDDMLAAIYYEQLASLRPSDPVPLLFAADALNDAGDPKGSVLLYQRYLEREPEDDAAWILLAEQFLELNQRRNAIDAYLRANNLRPRAQTQLAIGRLYLGAGNFAQAQQWFAQAIDGGSDNIRRDALAGLLETAARANRLGDALMLADQLALEFPEALEEPNVADLVGQLRQWRQRQDEALAAAEELARRQAEPQPEPEAEPEPEPATPEPEPVAETPPTAPSEPTPPTQPVAQAPAPQPAPTPAPPAAEPEPAPVAVTPAPEPEPEPVAEAEPEPAETPQQPPDMRTATYGQALAWARRQRDEGNLNDAIRYYTRALTVNDSQAEVWFELSDTYFTSGQYSWARASANEAARRAPTDPKYALQVVRVQQNTLRPEQLIGALLEARDRFPQSPEIALTLARAYRQLTKDTSSARRLYREFLQLAPMTHPQRDLAERELRSL
ncbi:MAG: tetratricopeptide repeat protein [Verrucomicrobiota bacterium JB022]|nr:tetratricopeptide repeat protein [Verrucomicrobiota bacterium JB022]